MKNMLLTRGSQFFLRESHVGAPSRVAEIQRPIGRAAPDLLRNRVNQRTRLFFRALAIFGIDSGSVPFDDLSLFVAQRSSPQQEPAIFSVSASRARFKLERLPSRKGCAPFVERTCM